MACATGAARLRAVTAEAQTRAARGDLSALVGRGAMPVAATLPDLSGDDTANTSPAHPALLR